MLLGGIAGGGKMAMLDVGVKNRTRQAALPPRKASGAWQQVIAAKSAPEAEKRAIAA